MKLFVSILLLLPALVLAQNPAKSTKDRIGDKVGNTTYNTDKSGQDTKVNSLSIDVANLKTGKLNVSDTSRFVGKLAGYRLMSPAEIAKLAGLSKNYNDLENRPTIPTSASQVGAVSAQDYTQNRTADQLLASQIKKQVRRNSFVTQTARIGEPYIYSRKLMNDPPMLYTGNMNESSQIANRQVIQLSDVVNKIDTSRVRLEGVAHFTKITNLNSQTYISAATKPATFAELQAYVVCFQTDAPLLEIAYLASGGPAVRVVVDGQLTTNNMVAYTDGGGGTYTLHVDFQGVRRFRDIRIETNNAFFISTVTVSAADSFVVPPVPTKLAVLGDSYLQIANADSYGYVLSRSLGWSLTTSGLGGSGYIANPGGRLNFPERVQYDIVDAKPDVVLICGGINDSETGFATATSQFFFSLRASLPDAIIIATGPWAPSTSSASTQVGKGVAIRSAVTAVGGYYIDNSSWLKGSGNTSAPNATGNTDILISGDGVHPNLAGQSYLGVKLAESINLILKNLN